MGCWPLRHAQPDRGHVLAMIGTMIPATQFSG
jgi:hypothetical protein